MAEKIPVTFSRNVKLNKDVFVKGASTEVPRSDYELLLKAGVLVGGGELPPIADNEDKGTENEEKEDFYLLSRSELERKKKSELVEFLKDEEIPFDEKLNKDELVDLIAGE